MARVYLETSYLSACVTDRDDTASAYRRQVSTGWWKEQRDHYELFVAQEVLAELSHPEFRRRADAGRVGSCDSGIADERRCARAGENPGA